MSSSKFILFLSLAVSQSAQAAAPQQTAEHLELGKKAFDTNCVVCHGDKGTGDGPAAMGLTPKPRNFVSEKFKNGDSAEAIFGTITNGSPGTSMPGFPQLDEKTRWSLAFYVMSLKARK